MAETAEQIKKRVMVHPDVIQAEREKKNRYLQEAKKPSLSKAEELENKILERNNQTASMSKGYKQTPINESEPYERKEHGHPDGAE